MLARVSSFTLLVNARLPIISVDVWYKRLPNNTAVSTVGTKTISLLATADRLRLTTINKDRTRLIFIQSSSQPTIQGT
jgi:hypothetical protein